MIDEAVEEEQGTKVNPIPLSSAYMLQIQNNCFLNIEKKTDDLSSNVHFGKYKFHFQFALDIWQRVWK